jgi:hypothetical protein
VQWEVTSAKNAEGVAEDLEPQQMLRLGFITTVSCAHSYHLHIG